MKISTLRGLLALLLLFVLAACSRSSDPAPMPNVGTGSDLVHGIGSIPIAAAEDLASQALDTFPGGLAGNIEVVAGPRVLINYGGDRKFFRSRITITSPNDLDDVVLLGLAVPNFNGLRPDDTAPVAGLRSAGGVALASEGYADRVAEITPTNSPDPNASAFAVLPNRASLVFYEDGEVPASISNALAELFGEEQEFGVFPYGFRAGNLTAGEGREVDLAFSLPQGSNVSSFTFVFVAVSDDEVRITQAAEEVNVTEAGAVTLDSGLASAENRFGTVFADELAILGALERDVTIGIENVVCIDDVVIAGGVGGAATRNLLEQFPSIPPSQCTLVDASGYTLILALGTEVRNPQNAGQPLDTTTGAPIRIVLENDGDPVEGRPIEVVITEPEGASFTEGTTTVLTNANGVAEFSDLILENTNNQLPYTIEFRFGEVPPVLETFIVDPGFLHRFAFADPFDNPDGPGIILRHPATGIGQFTAFNDDVPVTRSDNSPTDSAGDTTTIVALDRFGNFVRLNGSMKTALEAAGLRVEVLQDGTPVSDQTILFGSSLVGAPVECSNIDNYRNGTVSLDFGTGAPVISISGTNNPANRQICLFGVSQPGSGYQLRFTITPNNAANPALFQDDEFSPVLLTDEFSIRPTVASLEFIQPIATGTRAGEPLRDAAGQPVRVRLRDDRGDIIANREVTAQIISGTTAAKAGTPLDGIAVPGAIADITYLPGCIDNNSLVNCTSLFNFAGVDNDQIGGGSRDNTGSAGAAIDPNVYGSYSLAANIGATVNGRRTVTVETNNQGIAVFDGSNALTIGIPGSYRIIFYADNGERILEGSGATFNEGSASTAPLQDHNARVSASFTIIEGAVDALRPVGGRNFTTEATSPAPLGTETLGNISAVVQNSEPNGTGAFDQPIRLEALDRFGNRVVSGVQVIADLVNPGGNALYGRTTSGTGASRQQTTRTQFADPNNDGIITFPRGGSAEGELLIAANTSDFSVGLVADLDPRVAATNMRIRFTELGSNRILNSNSFNVSAP